MRRWRNLPFRRGQFWNPPPSAVVVVVQPPVPRIGHNPSRLPQARRGKFQPFTVTVTVVAAPVARTHRSWLPPFRRGSVFFKTPSFTPAPNPAQAPQALSHDAPRALPLPRRGRFEQVPITVQVVAPQTITQHGKRLAPFRRGQFFAQPITVVVTAVHPPTPTPLSHDAPRFLPLARRGRIAQPVPAAVTVTVQLPVPQSITARRRGLLAPRRGRFGSVASTVQSHVSVQLGHDPIRLPFQRRGKFLTQPVTVTVVTAPTTVPSTIRRNRLGLPLLRRGRFQPAPVAVTVVVTPHPIVARIPRALRPNLSRSARGKFFPFTNRFGHPPICLDGSITETNIDGTAVVSAYNGTGVTLQYNGTESRLVYNGTALNVSAVYNGTLTETNIDGTVTEVQINGTETAWCMIAVALTLGEFDDTSVNLAFTQSGGGALNIASAQIDVYLKTAAGISDTDASTKHYSSAGGSPAITITNGAGGLATCQIPNADIQNANFNFWKARVTIGGFQNTAMYGTVTTTLL